MEDQVMKMATRSKDLVEAFEVFSRPAAFDGSVYLAELDRWAGLSIVELGAGTGRLVNVWLAARRAVLAIESDPRLRRSLSLRFRVQKDVGVVVIRRALEDCLNDVTGRVMIAPYNVALHFPTAERFAETCRLALAAGAACILFDVDELTRADWQNMLNLGEMSRQIDDFREVVRPAGDRQFDVTWFRAAKQISRFALYSHAWEDLVAAIGLIPNVQLTALRRINSDVGGVIRFSCISNETSGGLR